MHSPHLASSSAPSQSIWKSHNLSGSAHGFLGWSGNVSTELVSMEEKNMSKSHSTTEDVYTYSLQMFFLKVKTIKKLTGW